MLPPLVVYVELSGYCNLKCNFCPHSSEKQFKKGIMGWEMFKKMTDDLLAFPEKIKLLRICGNGEPLLNKDIIRMLSYSRSKGVADKIELVTNGLLLNDDLITRLPKYLDRIIISIEGLSGDDYWRISNVKVDFEKLISNITKLYENRCKTVIHIKINSEAITSDKSRGDFFSLFGDYCDEIYIENLVDLWPQINTAYGTGRCRWGGDAIKHAVCVQIFKGLQVQSDGEVVPCCVDWLRVNIIGDIRDNTLSEIWRGEKLRKLQTQHLLGNKPALQPCKNCAMNDYCDSDNIDQYAAECLRRLQ